MANPISIISLFLITIGYMIFRYKMNMNNLSPALRTSLPFIYLIVLMLVQIATNRVAIISLCGSVDMGRVILATVIPWTAIFGILIMLLNVFPGWKAPFSNTIGYLMIRGDASEIIPKIFKGKMTADKSGEFAQALEYIYDDQSLLINEITPMNFDSFWDKMTRSNLIRDTAQIDTYKQKLRNLVKLKELTATGIWYLLAGLLVTSFSYQNMVSAKCEKSMTEMKKGEQSHKEQLKSEEEESRKIYRSRE